MPFNLDDRLLPQPLQVCLPISKHASLSISVSNSFTNGLSNILPLAMLLLTMVATAVAVDNETVLSPNDSVGGSFSRDVRPVLSNHCYQCHGPDEQERAADLRLDTQPEDVEALAEEIIRRVTSDDPDEVMPPPALKKELSGEQIESLKQWVHAGAKWEAHWAFQPVKRPSPPLVSNHASVHNEIDRFVIAKLEAQGLSLSTAADPATLLRRVYLDVLGLVPTPEEVQAFLDDTRPRAYERMVERVLANPRFGERWGRHWLDQARYADSDGYAIDGARVMWPYRDWVIRAINDDLPFDQFTIEQLAGDLLPEPSVDQLVATGFHRNTLINQEGGSDPEQFRIESVVDRTNTTSAVWLGLTVGCAQCHTHKFDPISHEEYYRFFAFFNSNVDKNRHEPRILAAPAETQVKLEGLKKQLEKVRSEIKRRKKLKFIATENREADMANATAREKSLKSSVAQIERRFGQAMVMRDLEAPRDTFLHIRGDFLRPGVQVYPNVPEVLGSLTGDGASSSESSKDNFTRLELAGWLVDQGNPLTARVTVNRMWLQYFGRGLVDTENDFGLQGTPPSHPLLLDWLASELVRQAWSTKSLHRLILNSATYRQSSRARADLEQRDANNLLLGRQVRLRVTAEVVRDLALSAAGMLSDRIGGPSVYPPQPEGVYAFTQNRKRWQADTGANRFRRGMYTFFYRSAAHPFLSTFDAPNFQTSCTKRLRSNTPLQSLSMANDESMLEAAKELGMLLAKHQSQAADTADTDGIRSAIQYGFQRSLGRPPNPAETSRVHAYYLQQQASFQKDPNAAREFMLDDVQSEHEPIDDGGGGGEGGGDSDSDSDGDGDGRRGDVAAWVAVARVLLNLDEFVTRN